MKLSARNQIPARVTSINSGEAIANVELEAAYQRLLAAAEAQPSESLRARDTFRGLVDAVTVLDGTLAAADDEPKPLSWGGGAAP